MCAITPTRIAPPASAISHKADDEARAQRAPYPAEATPALRALDQRVNRKMALETVTFMTGGGLPKG